MAREQEVKLDSRTARGKLAVSRKGYVKTLQTGVALLYYRGVARGSWSVRVFMGKGPTGKGSPYRESAVGLADDHAESDGRSILMFNEAVEAAFEKAQAIFAGAKRAGPYTVGQAVTDYLAWAEAHRKSHDDIKARLERHVVPAFGDRKVSALTHDHIEEWHRGIAKLGAFTRPKNNATERKRQKVKDPRARKVSANRELSYVGAGLKVSHRADSKLSQG